ncbi:MAG TPA: hypothetical protein VK325_10010 [Pseudoxanthomonas sp.]|nr:hypothetical protein [Pseudoxanthomonas sp.]
MNFENTRPTDSKRRRDAGGKNSTRAAKPKASKAMIEPHADLRDAQGRLLAGVVRRDGEWVLGMGGRIAGGSTEARVFALIRRAARLHEAQGTPVRLTFSGALKDAADAEAALRGITFEEFETELQRSLASGA